MSDEKAHLYVNSKGQYVTRHSYSGGDTFNFCAQKYYLDRVQGWSEKEQNAAKFFGTALEKAVTFWHQRKQNTAAAVAEFVRLWAEHKDQPYKYSKSDLDWDRLNLTGQELVKLYALRYPTFPYIVTNPDDFQVETKLEIFPGTRLQGLEFISYIDLMAEDKDTQSPIIIDMKTSGKDVPELTVMDPQLRSYAWAKRDMPRFVGLVAFLWFRKMGRTISKGDIVTILESQSLLSAGTESVVLAQDDFGLWVGPRASLLDEMDAQFKGTSKAVVAARQAFVEARGIHVLERDITKQRVQFKKVTISAASADDIGRSIKRDMINIESANAKGFWPMQSGVRYPNEKCPNCCMRGICSSQPEIRDTLLMRKQTDDLDFGSDSE